MTIQQTPSSSPTGGVGAVQSALRWPVERREISRCTNPLGKQLWILPFLARHSDINPLLHEPWGANGPGIVDNKHMIWIRWQNLGNQLLHVSPFIVGWQDGQWPGDLIRHPALLDRSLTPTSTNAFLVFPAFGIVCQFNYH